MKRILPIIIVVVFCGCHMSAQKKLHEKAEGLVLQKIRDLREADADRLAAERIKSGNWRLLALSGGMMEPTSLPGLSDEEIKKYLTSSRMQWEIYRFDQTYQGLASPELEKELSAARIDYATRLNRAMLKRIEAIDSPNHASQSATPAACAAEATEAKQPAARQP